MYHHHCLSTQDSNVYVCVVFVGVTPKRRDFDYPSQLTKAGVLQKYSTIDKNNTYNIPNTLDQSESDSEQDKTFTTEVYCCYCYCCFIHLNTPSCSVAMFQF